jgi:hypothetical protein
MFEKPAAERPQNLAFSRPLAGVGKSLKTGSFRNTALAVHLNDRFQERHDLTRASQNTM